MPGIRTLHPLQKEYLVASSYLDAVMLKTNDKQMQEEAGQFARNAAKTLCHYAYTIIKRNDQDAADEFRRVVFNKGWIRGADAAMEMELI